LLVDSKPFLNEEGILVQHLDFQLDVREVPRQFPPLSSDSDLLVLDGTLDSLGDLDSLTRLNNLHDGFLVVVDGCPRMEVSSTTHAEREGETEEETTRVLMRLQRLLSVTCFMSVCGT
jgi:hypothetical protein